MAKGVPADPKAADTQLRITDFGGMSPGTDQNDNAPGLSFLQVNCVSSHPGELRARRGMRPVRFEAAPVPAPTVRVANAATRLWLHEDARAGRDLAVAAFSGLALAGELESTIRARTDLVLTASADAEVA